LIHNLQAVAKYAEQHNYTSKQDSAKVEVKQDMFHYGGWEEKHAKDFAEVEQKSAGKQDEDGAQDFMKMKFEGGWDNVESSGKYNAAKDFVEVEQKSIPAA
jgi:hypothetical protein